MEGRKTCPPFRSSLRHISKILPVSLVCFSVTVIKHCDQQQLKAQELILAYTSRSQSITEGSQGRNPKQKSQRNLLSSLLTATLN